MKLKPLLVSLAIGLSPMLVPLPGMAQVESRSQVTTNATNVATLNLPDRTTVEYPTGWRSAQLDDDTYLITNVSEPFFQRMLQADWNGWTELPSGWTATIVFMSSPIEVADPVALYSNLGEGDQRRERVEVNGSEGVRLWTSNLRVSDTYQGEGLVTMIPALNGRAWGIVSLFEPGQSAAALPTLERIHNSLRQAP